MSTESTARDRTSPSGMGCLGGAILLGIGLFVFGVGLFVFGIGWIASSIPKFNLIGETTSLPLMEEYAIRGDIHKKDVQTAERVAVIHVATVLVEGLIDDAIDQIDMAMSDPLVKAVVVRIDSPGGTLSASEEIHRRLTKLKEGKGKDNLGTPIVMVASIGPIAASGGYYLAMPCNPILAEKSSQTGSIGVFVSFPSVEGLAKQFGFGVTIIKQGEIKDSGSPFRIMSPKEKQVWQDLVDDGYQQFIGVIEEGRPHLKGKLLETMTLKALRAGPTGADGLAEYPRYRADGGLWTARQAKDAGLIDRLGSLEEAIDEAIQKAGLPKDILVVEYERPGTFLDSVLGRDRRRHDSFLDIPGWEKALSMASSGPRAWCLAPGFELEGLAALAKRSTSRSRSTGVSLSGPTRPKSDRLPSRR